MKRIDAGRNLKARNAHAMTRNQMHKEETRRRVAWLTVILKNEVDKALGVAKWKKSGTDTTHSQETMYEKDPARSKTDDTKATDGQHLGTIRISRADITEGYGHEGECTPPVDHGDEENKRC